MNTESNQHLVLKFFEECWDRGNVAVLDELLAPNHVHHLPGIDLHGPEQVRNLILGAHEAFPDFHITLDDVIIAGEKIVCRWTIQGTNTGPFGKRSPTGKSVIYTGIDIIRCSDYRIVELWGQYDSRGLDRQLGQA